MRIVPPSIWLVGVDAKMASTLSAVLSSHGYVTEQISEKIIAFDRDPKPTAVLLSFVDTGMPALNVLVSAQKAVPPIPVVVLVGPDQARPAVEALKLGARDAMVIPLDPADLLSVLRALQQKDEEKARRLKVEAIPPGEFREDLYFRLSGMKIDIPALCDNRKFHLRDYAGCRSHSRIVLTRAIDEGAKSACL